MRKLWLAFALVLGVSFAVLGWIGVRISDQAPPIVDRVVTTDGETVVGPGEVQAGQNVWQSLGGMLVAEGLARTWDEGRRGWC